MDDPAETTKELAKAVKSVADIGNQVLNFVSKFIGEPAEQVGGMLTDRLTLSRWQKRLNYVEAVNKEIEDRGLDQPRAVPPKFVLPMIEHASLEEDADLQQRWVDLLANSMDPAFTVSLQTSFIEILNGLTAVDVRILDACFLKIRQEEISQDKLLDSFLQKDKIMEMLGLTESQYELSIFNLFRTGCMAAAVYVTPDATIDGNPMTTYLGTAQVCLTPLGYALMRSVQPKS